jgi:hypothetical protein
LLTIPCTDRSSCSSTGSNCQEERLIIVVSRLYIEASLELTSELEK